MVTKLAGSTGHAAATAGCGITLDALTDTCAILLTWSAVACALTGVTELPLSTSFSTGPAAAGVGLKINANPLTAINRISSTAKHTGTSISEFRRTPQEPDVQRDEHH